MKIAFKMAEYGLNAVPKKRKKQNSAFTYVFGFHFLSCHINVRFSLCVVKNMIMTFHCPLFDFLKQKLQHGWQFCVLSSVSKLKTFTIIALLWYFYDLVEMWMPHCWMNSSSHIFGNVFCTETALLKYLSFNILRSYSY